MLFYTTLLNVRADLLLGTHLAAHKMDTFEYGVEGVQQYLEALLVPQNQQEQQHASRFGSAGTESCRPPRQYSIALSDREGIVNSAQVFNMFCLYLHGETPCKHFYWRVALTSLAVEVRTRACARRKLVSSVI
jgi:hypothetical protein